MVLAFLLMFIWEKLVKHWELARDAYTHGIYYPLQRLRNLLFEEVVFSVGDVLYVLLIIFSIVAISRVFYKLWDAVKYKNIHFVLDELYRLLRWVFCIYAGFVISWGMNYTRKPLLYDVYKDQIVFDKALGRNRIAMDWDAATLERMLNETQQKMLQGIHIYADSTHYQSDSMNAKAKQYMNEVITPNGLASTLKVSSLGAKLQHVGIQGYFVPFTGEVHHSGNLFYLYRPFVYMHEMAHQKGIASETDANFLAYVICSEQQDPVFQFSAAFELFSYLISDLRRVDSAAFVQYQAQSVDPKIKELVVAAQKHRAQYKSFIRPYTMGLYDHFLKFFGQNEGLKSYSMMTYKVLLYRNNNMNLQAVLAPYE